VWLFELLSNYCQYRRSAGSHNHWATARERLRCSAFQERFGRLVAAFQRMNDGQPSMPLYG
jgi:hypothetical protein